MMYMFRERPKPEPIPPKRPEPKSWAEAEQERRRKYDQSVIQESLDDTKAAYHESGHALAQFALGYPVGELDITGYLDENGEARAGRYWATPLGRKDSQAADEAVIVLGAYISESKCFGKMYTYEDICISRFSDGDRQKLAEQGIFGRTDWRAFLERNLLYANLLINERWQAVEVLAKTLVKWRRISAHEADALIRQTGAKQVERPSQVTPDFDCKRETDLKTGARRKTRKETKQRIQGLEETFLNRLDNLWLDLCDPLGLSLE